MEHISLNAYPSSEITIIPNIFIDKYLPMANGAYVKVYLYLLKCYQCNINISINSIADHLDNTENDILRALFYWEKLNLLTISRNSNNKISSIHINIIKESSSVLTNDTIPHTIENNKTNQNNTQQDNILNSGKPNYSEDKITKLTNDDDVKWIMNIVELYLNRPLKPMDIQLILYLYDELHFSAELIMYLYEYCVSKGKKNTSYIEAVALNWAKDGIDTEEKAKALNTIYDERFKVVNKAFGLNRNPGQAEQKYIAKWFNNFKFANEIVEEACNRSLLRTTKPDFKYANSILETWFKKGVKSLDDINKLDKEFNKDKYSKTSSSNYQNYNKPSNNKFNQFPQRNYSEDDYALLEKKLLNKGL